jgi:hypothetical protein
MTVIVKRSGTYTAQAWVCPVACILYVAASRVDRMLVRYMREDTLLKMSIGLEMRISDASQYERRFLKRLYGCLRSKNWDLILAFSHRWLRVHNHPIRLFIIASNHSSPFFTFRIIEPAWLLHSQNSISAESGCRLELVG